MPNNNTSELILRHHLGFVWIKKNEIERKLEQNGKEKNWEKVIVFCLFELKIQEKNKLTLINFNSL